MDVQGVIKRLRATDMLYCSSERVGDFTVLLQLIYFGYENMLNGI